MSKIDLGYPHSVIDDGKGGTIIGLKDMPQTTFDLVKQNFTPRPDDVLIATFPRSGTIWTRQLVHLLSNGDETDAQGFSETIPFLDPIGDELATLIAFEQRQSPRYFCSHRRLSLMPGYDAHTDRLSGRYIYVVRNPKDCAVSYYHFSKKSWLIEYTGTWDHYCELFFAGLVPWGSYFDHVSEWWQASQRFDNILFIHYEEMKRDLASVVTRLADWLDIDATPQVIERVLDGADFGKMGNNPQTNMHEFYNKSDTTNGSPHMRKGTVGDWRNYFTEEQSARFDEMAQDRLASIGLGLDFG
ncbi:MAG: sulfotransferase domain-containing protein [Chloroflexota bacterium]